MRLFQIIPLVPGEENDDCISFTADERDAATIIHAYCTTCIEVPRVKILCDTSEVELTREEVIAFPDNGFAAIINKLYGD